MLGQISPAYLTPRQLSNRSYNKSMRKFILVLSTFFLILTISFTPQPARAEPVTAPQFATAYELIDAVNALRATYGLPPYKINSILMSNAQKQADYNLAIGTVTHTSADGLTPSQRALQAGYPVAGNISGDSPGWFSENIASGANLTADQVVEIWKGDSPHLTTMVSSELQDIGAGVAFSDNTSLYYVIDCGRSTGGTPVPFTPPPSYHPPQATMIPNTPNADGSITYIVQQGDTLLGIALGYGMTLDELLAMNGLPEKSFIYPGQKILIRAGYTQTPTLPTSTPTGRPTITPWPTSTPTFTQTPILATPTPSARLTVSSAGVAVMAIVFSAFVIAALIAITGRKRK